MHKLLKKLLKLIDFITTSMAETIKDIMNDNYWTNNTRSNFYRTQTCMCL